MRWNQVGKFKDNSIERNVLLVMKSLWIYINIMTLQGVIHITTWLQAPTERVSVGEHILQSFNEILINYAYFSYRNYLIENTHLSLQLPFQK